MEELNYKEEISQSRQGALGGSDGSMLNQIASLGYVPKSAYKRMAIMNGLIESPDIVTPAMRFGDFIEQSIFASLFENNPNYQSNPLWVSGKYSKDGTRLICHPDFVFFDEDNKILKVWECKATKLTPKQTREHYLNQLFIEWTIANEIVKARGEGWKVQLFLCHYDTNDVDLTLQFEFDPQRLSVHKLRMTGNVFDIDKAMNIVHDFAQTFDYYTEDEEIDAKYLPENVKTEFDTVTGILAEIKQHEVKVDEFKKKLCKFMQEKNIKSIKNDAWNITLVGASETVSFDSKKYLADLAAEHPRIEKALRKKYEKRTAKGAYVQIKIKTKKDEDK